LDYLDRLHQPFPGLIPAVELDDKGFWGRRQEFKERMQIQSPGLF
jgi:hypothetical protein